jgi:hypothetical protein
MAASKYPNAHPHASEVLGAVNREISVDYNIVKP